MRILPWHVGPTCAVLVAALLASCRATQPPDAYGNIEATEVVVGSVLLQFQLRHRQRRNADVGDQRVDRSMVTLGVGDQGLGHLLVTAARTFQAVDMFVPLITISLLGLILNGLLQAVRSYLLRGFPEV